MDKCKQNLIDRYMQNEMTVNEQLEFEKLLTEDAELQEQYEFTKNAVTAIKSRNKKLEIMKKWEEAFPKKEVDSIADASACNGKYMVNKHHKRNYWIAGITSIVAMCVFGYFLFNSAPIEMPTLQIEYYEGIRGGELGTISQLITEKKYNEALMLIEKKEKELQENDLDYPMNKQRIYIYNSMLHLKVYALIGLDKQKEALELLNRIRKGEGPHKAWADSLYKEWK